jgi:hypothetical protein
MSAPRVSVWWNKQTKAWVTEIDRKRITLAKLENAALPNAGR